MDKVNALMEEHRTHPLNKVLALALVDALVEDWGYEYGRALRCAVGVKQTGLCDAEWAEAAALVRVESPWYIAIREVVRARLGMPVGHYFRLDVGPSRQRIHNPTYDRNSHWNQRASRMELKPRFVLQLVAQMKQEIAKREEERQVVTEWAERMRALDNAVHAAG
jgi:hypothetical protein